MQSAEQRRIRSFSTFISKYFFKCHYFWIYLAYSVCALCPRCQQTLTPSSPSHVHLCLLNKWMQPIIQHPRNLVVNHSPNILRADISFAVSEEEREGTG